jgi:hypothetical protein
MGGTSRRVVTVSDLLTVRFSYRRRRPRALPPSTSKPFYVQVERGADPNIPELRIWGANAPTGTLMILGTCLGTWLLIDWVPAALFGACGWMAAGAVAYRGQTLGSVTID